MSVCQWETILQNGWFPQIVHLYGRQFPIEVRSIVAGWLSKDDRYMGFDPNERSHHDYIRGFIGAFSQRLNHAINAHPSDGEANFYHKRRLQDLFREIQSQDPIQLFQTIKYTLSREKQTIDQLTAGVSSNQPKTFVSTVPTFHEMKEQIDNAMSQIKSKCETFQKEVTLRHDELNKLKQLVPGNGQNGNATHADGNVNSNLSIQQIKEKWDVFHKDMWGTYSSLGQIVDCLVSVHTAVLSELEKWNDDQRLVALGKSPYADVESIEEWFINLSSKFEELEMQIPVFKDICISLNYNSHHINSLQRVLNQIVNLRRKMVQVALIIPVQSKPKARKSNNFGPIDLMVLPFSTSMKIDGVKYVFINQKTAKEYCKNTNHTDMKLPMKSGELSHGKIPVSISERRVRFQHMSVEKVAKSVKRGVNFVVEEPFYIYFRVSVKSHQEEITLWTTSLPISYTTHPIQDAKAWTYILWYNAFPVKSRLFFDVPDHISWSLLFHAINIRFINLGRGLSDEQNVYLKEKLFRGVIPPNEQVDKARFCNETFAKGKVESDASEDGKQFIKSYSFGEWINCCVKILQWSPKNTKLASLGVRHFWADERNVIIGFMSKEKTQALLEACPPGTFIIKCPETVPDTIALYFYCRAALPSNCKLITQLLTTKDFQTKTLQDRISDNKGAIYVYPNIEKEKVFTSTNKVDTIVDSNGYFVLPMQEYFPSSILKCIKPDLNCQSPFSSNSVHSYINSCSPFSDSNAPETQMFSPSHVTSTSRPAEDFSMVLSGIDGIDPNVIMEENDFTSL